ncbi:MAG: hypothetical protein H0V17_17985 [Deltaproteobacteria bacterium]|nr:hypothetical protein [Deltaproteobacteria bacterium]
MDRRAELGRYIDEPRRHQRLFTLVLAPLLLVALALMFWSTTIGGFAFLGVGITAITGHWVLYAHLASHQQQLHDLSRLKRPPEGPQTGGHRRWNRSLI